MAAAKKKFFSKGKSPAKALVKNEEQSISALKDQLASLQSKIASLEGGDQKSQEIEVETLFEWESAAHVFIPRGKKWIMYVVLTTALIILVLLVIKEFFIIAPVLAVAFLAYILASVPPENIEHRLTSQGVITGNHNYIWEEIYDFWFTEKHGHTILNMDLQAGFPARVIMIVNQKDKEKIKSILLRYLPYREVPDSGWLDRFGDSLSNFFHKLAS